MVGRVSSHGLSTSLLQSAMSVQSKYAEANTQEASGLVSSTYTGLGSKAATLISLESTVERITTWNDTTQTASSRVDTMYSAVGDMIDKLTSLRSTLSAAMSDTSESVDLNTTGEDLLDDLADLMNTQQDGRYLFAGSNTDTAPVDVSALTAPSIPSSADTSYYTGDDELMSVRVSENQSITYGVTADGTGFEEALRAANIIANITTSPVDEDALNEAYELATSALDALTAAQASLSVNASRLDSAAARQETTLSLLDTMTSDIKNVDTAEIAVKVSEYQTQLQASYSALSSISKLSLTNYL